MNRQVCEKAISHYGVVQMLNVCIEEPAELIQAISKLRRYGRNITTRSNLVEEIADVYIILEELKIMYDIGNHEIDDWISYKQIRTIERIVNDRKVQ